MNFKEDEVEKGKEKREERKREEKKMKNIILFWQGGDRASK